MKGARLHGKAIRKAEGIALGWGFVEAMLFFIVPDVFLSVVALHSLRRALWTCVWAVAGALVGGSVMYAWGAHDPLTALRVLDAVPAIPADMLVTVRGALAKEGLVAMLSGPLIGIPYKIYAVQAGALGLSWPAFALMTVPARIIRFVITCVAFNLIARPIRRYGGARLTAACWLLFWILNYTFYWHATMRP